MALIRYLEQNGVIVRSYATEPDMRGAYTLWVNDTENKYSELLAQFEAAR